MEINRCLLRSVHCIENPEGFSTTVHRGETVRGPFATIAEAIRCAHDWSEATSESSLTKTVDGTPLVAIETTP